MSRQARREIEMSIKRIKFLKRKKILQQDVRVALESNGQAKRFTANAELADYGFPAESQVWIDAKQLLETMRFDLGTVGSPRPSVSFDISKLKGERVTFNLWVVDAATARKLGSAEALRQSLGQVRNQDSIALLPVDGSARLDGVIWRIDYSEQDEEGHSDAPVLMIDRDAAKDSASVFIQDPGMRAAILPPAMKEILTKLLLVDRCEYDPESRSWRDSWIRFAARLLAEDPPDRSDGHGHVDDVMDWINRATCNLARSAKLLDSYLAEVRS